MNKTPSPAKNQTPAPASEPKAALTSKEAYKEAQLALQKEQVEGRRQQAKTEKAIYRAATRIYLRSGAILEIERVVHLDNYNVLVELRESGEWRYVAKHAIDQIELDKSRVPLGGAR